MRRLRWSARCRENAESHRTKLALELSSWSIRRTLIQTGESRVAILSRQRLYSCWEVNSVAVAQHQPIPSDGSGTFYSPLGLLCGDVRTGSNPVSLLSVAGLR